MNASECAAAGPGVIILHKCALDTECGKGFLVIALEEKTPLVGKDTRLQDYDSLNKHARSSHFSPLVIGQPG